MAITEVRGCCPHDCPDTCSWTATVEDGRRHRGPRQQGPPVHGRPPLHQGEPLRGAGVPPRSPPDSARPHGCEGRRAPSGKRRGTRRSAWRATGSRASSSSPGPEAVLPFSYMGTQGVLQGASMDQRFFHRLGSAELDRNICLAAGGWAYAFTYPGFAATDPELIGEAEVAIAWGVNPFSTHLHFWPYFQAVKKNGGTLITRRSVPDQVRGGERHPPAAPTGQRRRARARDDQRDLRRGARRRRVPRDPDRRRRGPSRPRRGVAARADVTRDRARAGADRRGGAPVRRGEARAS